MAVDGLMRTLKVPPKFVPYLEKHRIYELFYDLGNELAMVQPEDSLTFIKEYLERSILVRDTRLVMIIAPPHVDKIELAHHMSIKTGDGMLSRYIMCGKSGKDLDPIALAKNTADYIRSSNNEGWIFVDYPETKQEAKMLIKQKVVPTHTLLLNEYSSHLNEVKMDSQNVNDYSSVLSECEKNILELKELFKSSLKVVNIKEKSLEDIASLCTQLTMDIRPRPPPKLFRVALIGPKGSRRRTIAKLLQDRYKLVHVDIFQLINSARQLDNDLGDEIKRLEKCKLPFSNKLIFDLLKSRLSSKDCLERGYVLTNYPSSREDFVLLDSSEVPPNKVIFLEVESDVCKQRLEDRVNNMYSGKVHSKKLVNEDNLLRDQTLTHPDDELCVVEEDLKFYDKHLKGMMDYCGHTGHVINGRGSINALLERVEYVLMCPAPSAKARSGRIVEQTSICSYNKKIRNIAAHYPLPRTEVVPLIDSEELLNRFKELKKSSPKSSFQKDPERYSLFSKDLNPRISPSEISKNGHSYCICSLDNLQNTDDDYCTCEEPQLVDED